jgi:hypothetical protein
MTKPSKRREAKKAATQDAPAEGVRQKRARTEAAAMRPDPSRTGESKASRHSSGPRTRLFTHSHDDDVSLDDLDRDLDREQEDNKRTGDDDAGREVLESIDRWREQLALTIETMATQPARASKQQVTAMLSAQRELAEQVKSGLTQFQVMLDSWESQIEQMGAAAQASTAQAPLLPGLPMLAGFMPNGDLGAPMQVPMKALWSMQKAAVSSAGLWAKAAQDYQGIWMGAMQSMMPGNGTGGVGRKHR